MEKIVVNLGDRSYPIYIGHGILGELGVYYKKHELGRKAAVISSRSVADSYLDLASRSLQRADLEVVDVVIPDGEEHKNLETADVIYEKLIENRLDRSSAIVALGGGVVGDIAGFVAATFLRGIDLVQVPTSIVAQVDASIGGKVAVDHKLGKNLIGAFHQPRFVLVDTDLLRSLPQEEIRSGIAEVIKHGLIADEGLFSFLEDNLEDILELKVSADQMDDLIARNCRIKAHIVSGDEKEEGDLRATLNYGHTVGHAIEAAGHYSVYRHGEAVILGMVAAGSIAERLGLFKRDDLERQNSLLSRVGVPKGIENISTSDILDRMKSDKKVKEGVIRFVLPQRIGKVIVTDKVNQDQIRAGIEYMRKWANSVRSDSYEDKS